MAIENIFFFKIDFSTFNFYYSFLAKYVASKTKAGSNEASKDFHGMQSVTSRVQPYGKHNEEFLRG
jgi:hypothetical protein